MSLSSKIKSSPNFKRLVLRLLIPSNDYKPRGWVRIFLNPFKHKRGKGSKIRRRTRMDVFPYNNFQLGANSIIEDFSTINNGVGDVQIGDRTIIGIGNVIIGPVSIGNDVMIAQNVVISGLNHSYENIDIPPRDQKVSTKKITIRDNAWIGANSTITAGVTIGRHSIIGAGSVITNDIGDYCVAVGNPARVIKKYNSEAKTWEKV